ncbi:hypothetical protein V8C86DRAFT_2584315 [Haematococcus lacustris]
MALSRTWILYEMFMTVVSSEHASKLMVLAQGVTLTPLLVEVFLGLETSRSLTSLSRDREVLLERLRQAAYDITHTTSTTSANSQAASLPAPPPGLEATPVGAGAGGLLASAEELSQAGKWVSGQQAAKNQEPEGEGEASLVTKFVLTRQATLARSAASSGHLTVSAVLGDLTVIDRLLRSAMLESSKQEAKRVEKRLRTRNPSPAMYLSRTCQAALMCHLSGRPAESEALLRPALAYLLEGGQAGSQHLLLCLQGLFNALVDQGKIKDAVLVARKAHDAADRLLGPDHVMTTQMGLKLCEGLLAGQQVAAAEALARCLLVRLERVHAACQLAHPDCYRAYYALGVTLRMQHRLKEAVPVLQASLRIQQQVEGEGHPGCVMPLLALGRAQAAMNLHGDAVATFTQA